jgi:hypothetical protein
MQMIAGSIAVHEALGPDASGITQEEIEEALWHYYYDVEKSVAYLRNKRAKKEHREKKKKKGGWQFCSSVNHVWPVGVGGVGGCGIDEGESEGDFLHNFEPGRSGG